MHNNDPTPYLPFFVYGTLIPGQPNDYLVRDVLVSQQSAVFQFGRLYAFPTFPMLLETNQDEGTSIAGRLITIESNNYLKVVAQLDKLEQFNPEDLANSPYIRAIRSVQTADGQQTKAWLYLGQSQFILPQTYHITSGSWLQYCQMANNDASIQRWWKEHDINLLFGKSQQSD